MIQVFPFSRWCSQVFVTLRKAERTTADIVSSQAFLWSQHFVPHPTPQGALRPLKRLRGDYCRQEVLGVLEQLSERKNLWWLQWYCLGWLIWPGIFPLFRCNDTVSMQFVFESNEILYLLIIKRRRNDVSSRGTLNAIQPSSRLEVLLWSFLSAYISFPQWRPL